MARIRVVVGVLSCLLFVGLAVPVWTQAQEAEPAPEVTRTADPAVGVARGALQGAGEAATEVGMAVKSGGEQVGRQGRDTVNGERYCQKFYEKV
jgi:hypothetical protein